MVSQNDHYSGIAKLAEFSRAGRTLGADAAHDSTMLIILTPIDYIQSVRVAFQDFSDQVHTHDFPLTKRPDDYKDNRALDKIFAPMGLRVLMNSYANLAQGVMHYAMRTMPERGGVPDDFQADFQDELKANLADIVQPAPAPDNALLVDAFAHFGQSIDLYHDQARQRALPSDVLDRFSAFRDTMLELTTRLATGNPELHMLPDMLQQPCPDRAGATPDPARHRINPVF